MLGKLILRIYIKGPTKVLEIAPEVENFTTVLEYCETMVTMPIDDVMSLRPHPHALSSAIRSLSRRRW